MHKRSLHDQLQRAASGQWSRLPDAPVVRPLRDMLYGTVGSYDATNKVITTTGTPTELPTGTPAIPAGIKVYDRENAGFSASDHFYAIRSVNVHTDGTHGQVDWVVIPTAAANPVRVVLVDSTSMSQSSGDPVPPLTISGSESNYWSGTLDSTGDVWIQRLDHRRLGRKWLPVNGAFKGILAGTYDPNVADSESFPTSDERPVYKIDPESDGETIAIVTTEASAADWSTDTEPAPSTDGRCSTFKIDETGARVVDQTGVAFVNYSKDALAVDSIIALEEFQGEQFATPLSEGGGGAFGKFGYANGTISGYSSGTWGSGSVSVYELDTSTGEESDTGVDETWWNMSSASIDSGARLQAKPIMAADGSTFYAIDWEACDL